MSFTCSDMPPLHLLESGKSDRPGGLIIASSNCHNRPIFLATSARPGAAVSGTKCGY
jgi:hypothetical protein